MKVTTELKRVIGRAFELKHQTETKRLREEAEEMYEKRVSEIESSDEFQEYCKACKKLYEYLEPDSKIAGIGYCSIYERPYAYERKTFNQIEDPKGSHFISSTVHTYVRNHQPKGISEQKDELLVKLTYEKDLDKIKEILKEYGIEI